MNFPHANNASLADRHQANSIPNASPVTIHRHNSSTARQQDAPQTAQSPNHIANNATQVKLTTSPNVENASRDFMSIGMVVVNLVKHLYHIVQNVNILENAHSV